MGFVDAIILWSRYLSDTEDLHVLFHFRENPEVDHGGYMVVYYTLEYFEYVSE